MTISRLRGRRRERGESSPPPPPPPSPPVHTPESVDTAEPAPDDNVGLLRLAEAEGMRKVEDLHENFGTNCYV